MTPHAVARLEKWFYAYVDTFASDDPAFQENINLKKQHTRRVCENVQAIGRDIGLDEPDLRLASITALFHDVGRFEQYREFRTFSDRKSVNHARFGIDILKRKGVLDFLDTWLADFILTVIDNHNQVRLPDTEDRRCLLFSGLLRDADKLDIWRVVTSYYAQKTFGRTNETIELDLPDTPGFNPQIYDSLISGKAILFDQMKNLNDFKLLQVGWVYDLNFVPSLARLKQRGYLKMMEKVLPKAPEIEELFAAIYSYMETAIKSRDLFVRPLEN